MSSHLTTPHTNACVLTIKMNETATVIAPALPHFLPQPAGLPRDGSAVLRGIPVAPFAMQKILSKAIRSHAGNQNLRNTAVKGPDKMGSPRRSGAKAGGKRAGQTGRAGKTSTGAARK